MYKRQAEYAVNITKDVGGTTENMARFIVDNAVELYFNNTKRFETTTTGITVTGKTETDSLDVSGHAGIGSFTVAGVSTFQNNVKLNDSVELQFGTGGDSSIQFNGSLTRFKAITGELRLAANALRLKNKDDNETYLAANDNGPVELYYDNVKKLSTDIGGVQITGVTTSSGGFSGNLSGTATLATDLAINGTNQIVYQDSNNDSDVLPTGNAGQILASSGAGAAPQWVNSAPAGAIEGITIRDESTIVGTANSISTINFIGSVVTADAAVGAGIATVTVNAIAGLGVSEGSGSKATGATGLDFVGPLIGVDASSNTGISTVRVDALTIKDEGSTVGTAGSITTINFVGSGIAAAVSGDTATVTSSGGVTNADVVALAIALG